MRVNNEDSGLSLTIPLRLQRSRPCSARVNNEGGKILSMTPPASGDRAEYAQFFPSG